MITIVLADDHHVVRQGLRALLESEPDFRVVGEAGDGITTAQLVENLKPNILVLDLMMTGMNGLECARQVSKRSPKTITVILSMHSNEGYVLEALRAGAKAYILKESSADELVHAIREVIAGRRYLGPPLSDLVIDNYLRKAENNDLDPYEALTAREREVLHLAAQGNTNAEIAARLFISRRTAEIHRTNMMRKLGLRTQTQLVRYAMQRGILPPTSKLEST
ncbi:MAG: response regulator transcription factor [Dehalococcoidales bacterium]|nr:response regulator transcription factor [Dehalococcoidales bacterium]